MADAGRAALLPKGNWQKTVAYEMLDIVAHNNKCWIAKKSSIGEEPAENDYWMLAVENVEQTQIDDIISGETLVGNSSKLTLTDTVTKTVCTMSLEDGIIVLREVD